MNDFPVILAHGIARFDFLSQRLSNDLSLLGLNFGLANNELNYFKGVARHLRANGFDVYQSSVGFAEGVENRAAALKDEIENFLALRPGTSKVHIIAHSMGGLDARHMIVGHGMSNKVSSLTTIGTPHTGTSFADWGMANHGHEILKIINNVVDFNGFADLTTDACRTFNEAAKASEAANSVIYQTYAARQLKQQIFAPLQFSWQIIKNSEGDNDGLVPISSQLWETELADGNGASKKIKQHFFSASADHLNEVGWWI